MKVLWITNTLFPDICKELSLPTPIVGGWMFAAMKNLMLMTDDIEFAIASTYSGKTLVNKKINNVDYYLLPKSKARFKANKKWQAQWKHIKNTFSPDIVHIHGTEYPYGLAYLHACGNKGVVISIQGLIGICAKYSLGGIAPLSILKNITPRDIAKRTSPLKNKKEMNKGGVFEKQTISLTQALIGRTEWDKAHCWSVNPHATYFKNNETLRDSFYLKEWDINTCEPYTIFLSQAYYPLKGFHMLLDALPLIKEHFPQVKVYVAGYDFFRVKWWKIGTYGKYILRKIKQLGVQNQVIFTGVLNEDKMLDQYLNAHVFVCPSSIENSSNSVGEAQLLGVPVVASNVGGLPSLIENGENGFLYQFDDTELLAHYVCQIFRNEQLAKTISENAKKEARLRHNKERNAKKLIEIYSSI